MARIILNNKLIAAGKSFVQVSNGATAEVYARINMQIADKQSIKEALLKHKKTQPLVKQLKSDATFAEYGNLFAEACAIGLGVNQYKNQTIQKALPQNAELQAILYDLQQVQTVNVRLEGRISAVAQGAKPVNACVFIERTTFKFKDVQITVVNNDNVVVGDKNGDTSKFKKKKGAINIVPI